LVAVTVGILVVVGVSLANQAGRATLSLQVGECFDAPTQASAITDVPRHPCTATHTGEVFAVVSARQSGAYPDREAFQKEATDLCAPLFVDYTGRQPGASSGLTFDAFWPTEQGWAAGDRTIDCYVVRLDGSPSTQSYRAT